MFRLQCHEQLTRLPAESAGTLADFDLDLWVERVRKDLSGGVKEQLATFFDFESFLGLAMVQFAWKTDAWHSVDDFLAQLERTSPLDLFAEFLKTGYTPGDLDDAAKPEAVRDYIRQTNLPTAERWKLAYLYLDAEHTKEQFIRLLSDCYRGYFMREEGRLAHLQEISAQSLRARIRGRRDLVDWLPYLTGHSVEDSETTVVLAPSVFYHVDSLSAVTDGGALVITLYGTNFRVRAPIGRDELSAFLKIVSDESRIKIIKTLGAGASYGYDLAQRLHLSNSTISHHLGLLATLGIVEPTREENRVSYALNRTRLTELLASLAKALTG
jgi:DNA-binding transcriptional ArsR family regulator